MNQRPALGWIALLVAITSAIAVVLLMSGMPAEAFAAAGSTGPSPATEPGNFSWLLTGLVVVLWLATRRGE